MMLGTTFPIASPTCTLANRQCVSILKFVLQCIIRGIYSQQSSATELVHQLIAYDSVPRIE